MKKIVGGGLYSQTPYLSNYAHTRSGPQTHSSLLAVAVARGTAGLDDDTEITGVGGCGGGGDKAFFVRGEGTSSGIKKPRLEYPGENSLPTPGLR